MTSKSSSNIPPSIKQARKALAARIRNDFEYTFPSHLNGIHQTLNIATATNDASPVTLGTVTEWRERIDSDPSTTEEDEEPSKVVQRQRTRMDAEYDGDGFGRQIEGGKEDEERRQNRKRRRRERAEEEMEWNTGLAFWEARRDAWCAVRKVPAGYNYNPNQNTSTFSSSSTSTSQSQPTSSSSSYHHPQQHQTQTQNPMRLIKILPIPPPLLPTTDPTRASITPAMYPSIYTKVVNQGLTPAVPINLSDVIPALVQGWQNDGEWPPKPSVPEPSMTTRMKNSLREQGQGGGGAYSRHPMGYGAPKREGDVVVGGKKRGVGGLLGAVTGIMAGSGGSGNANANSKKEKEKEKEQQPPTPPRNAGTSAGGGGTGSGGGDQGMRRIISRHLRSKSSILSLSSARSDTQTTVGSVKTEKSVNTERSGNGNISDNDTPGGNGLFEENVEKRTQSPSTSSPMSKRKSPSKVTRVLRSWASGSMPAHHEAAGG